MKGGEEGKVELAVDGGGGVAVVMVVVLVDMKFVV